MSDLTQRLRGIYKTPVNDGAGLMNGKDYVLRTFTVPPIQKEAANAIEKLQSENSKLKKALAKILSTDINISAATDEELKNIRADENVSANVRAMARAALKARKLLAEVNHA